jgi:sialic acid synthase SpsE
VVGWSDHSVGSLAATLSLALGATVFEKHFTLDKDMEGPDHKASSTPEEMRELVNSIRRAEIQLGSYVKALQEEERQMSQVSRKSIVARRDIAPGAKLQAEDLIMRRPGTGLPSSSMKSVLKLTARRAIPEGVLIDYAMLE